MGTQHLESDFVSEPDRYRYRGSSGKVNLALDRLPQFRCRPGDGLHMRGDIAIAPSIDYLETAFDEAKYGAFSKRPYINVVIPSLTDPSVAPPGKHVMSCFVQYAPYHLKGCRGVAEPARSLRRCGGRHPGRICPRIERQHSPPQVVTPGFRKRSV